MTYLSTKIYDKRDDFNFKIINFPNMCSNIPASPAYGVYISQLIRYDSYLLYLFLEQGFSHITGSINRIDVYNKC